MADFASQYKDTILIVDDVVENTIQCLQNLKRFDPDVRSPREALHLLHQYQSDLLRDKD